MRSGERRGALDSQQMQWDNELHLLPLPLGEVDERSEDGEGIPGRNALSVTFGDSSPKGGAKDVLAQEMERICTDTLHSLFYDHPSNAGAALFACKKRKYGRKFTCSS